MSLGRIGVVAGQGSGITLPCPALPSLPNLRYVVHPYGWSEPMASGRCLTGRTSPLRIGRPDVQRKRE